MLLPSKIVITAVAASETSYGCFLSLTPCVPVLTSFLPNYRRLYFSIPESDDLVAR